jgi:ParB-like chromosome segregation protein Spo0J
MADDIEQGEEGEVAAVWVSIGKLTEWADNPRVNENAVPGVKKSIKAFGFGAPLVARKANGELIAGHTRVRAAVELGMTRLPVRYMDISAKQAHRLARADNKTGEKSRWDHERLLEQLRLDIEEDGRHVVEQQGFAAIEVNRVMSELAQIDLTPDDAAVRDKRRKRTVTVTFWSTDEEQVLGELERLNGIVHGFNYFA